MTGYTDFETVAVTLAAGVLTATLNRPEALNAVTPTMARELVRLVDEARADSSVRVVVLTGAGRAFCAGGDVYADALPASTMSSEQFRLNFETYAAPMIAIAELDRPVIAAVNGVAVGAGWDLALACDIRIAASTARFKDAYVQLGIVPGTGGSYFLPRLAGLGRAKLISFTGEFVSAEDAQRWGLVEEVVEADQLDRHTDQLARRIAAGPTTAIGMTKLAMNWSLDHDLRESIDHAKAITGDLVGGPENLEAIAAFTEKRALRWGTPS